MDGAFDEPVEIRPYVSTRDRDALIGCIIEQQNFHRSLEPSWPEGEAIADEYLSYLEKQSVERDGCILLAEAEEGIVGFVAVAASIRNDSPDDPSSFAWIYDVFVKAGHRRRGLASRLMAEAESFARTRGAECLRLGVLAANGAAQELYRALGFRGYVNIVTKPIEPKRQP